MAAGTGGPCRRAIRRFMLGSGPLKRCTDRVQVTARIVLVLAVVLAPVPAATAVATTATRLHALAAEQEAERHRVEAVLLVDAERLTASNAAYGDSVVVPVRAGWRTPEGLRRESTIFVAPGIRAGTTVRVWLGSDGGPVAPPLPRGDIAGRAVASGALVLLAVPLAAWALYAGLVVALDTHRAHRWAKEWAAVESRWGTRLS
jgi:hypothetical protein